MSTIRRDFLTTAAAVAGAGQAKLVVGRAGRSPGYGLHCHVG